MLDNIKNNMALVTPFIPGAGGDNPLDTLEDLAKGLINLGKNLVENFGDYVNLLFKVFELALKFIQVIIKIIVRSLPLIELIIFVTPLLGSIYVTLQSLSAFDNVDMGPRLNAFKPIISKLSIGISAWATYFIYTPSGLNWVDLYPSGVYDFDIDITLPGRTDSEPDKSRPMDVQIFTSTLPGPTTIREFILWSQDRKSYLSYQADGNLVLYVNKLAVWSSGTVIQPIVGKDQNFVFNQDGSLVIQSVNGNILWRSHNGSPDWASKSFALQLDNNGSLSVVDSLGITHWSVNKKPVPSTIIAF